MKITTVFFDIDNTLLNHTGAERGAILAIKQKYFPHIQEEKFIKTWIEQTEKYWKLFELKQVSFKKQRTLRILNIWKLFGQEITKTDADKIFQEFLAFYEQNWEVFPQVSSVLKTLSQRGLQLGIITNGSKKQQLQKLTKMGIKHFINDKLIIVSQEVKFAKPQKEIFLHAQKLVNAKPEQIFYVGDNYAIDIEPARLLKWNTFHINHFGSSQEAINNFMRIFDFL